MDSSDRHQPDILLLGAGGFIGSHLCVALRRRNRCRLTALDLDRSKIDQGLAEAVEFDAGVSGSTPAGSEIRYVDLDIVQPENRERLDELIAGHDIVVNMIAVCNPALYVSDPLGTFEIGFRGNLDIIDSCVRHDRRLIHFSTCEVYGKSPAVYVEDEAFWFDEEESNLIMGPVSRHRWIYASGKQLLERYIHAHGLQNGLDYTIIRPFNYIGQRIDYLPSEQTGNPRVFSHFMNALLTGEPLSLVNGGEQRRAYLYIRDATEAHLRIIENEGNLCSRRIFNVGNPANETSIRDLAVLMSDIWRERFMSPGEVLPGLREVSGEEFYGVGYDDIDRRLPLIDAIRECTGWEPVYGLREMLVEIMEYYHRRVGSIA